MKNKYPDEEMTSNNQGLNNKDIKSEKKFNKNLTDDVLKFYQK